VLRARLELGEYHRLVHELRSDPQRFRRYFRMSTSQFDDFAERFAVEISKLDTIIGARRSHLPNDLP